MADIPTKSVEEQVDDVIEKAKKGVKIQEPLTQAIEDAARRRAQTLEANEKKKVIDALDELRKTVISSDPLGKLAQDKEFENELKNNLKRQLESMDGKLDNMSPQDLESALNTTENILNIQWIENIPGMKEKAREILQYQPMIQGIVGATLIQKLESIGYSFYFTKPNTIKVVSKKSDATEMEIKLNTHLAKSSVLADSIRSGFLYLSPSFHTYRSAVSGPEGKLTDPSAVTIDSYKNALSEKKKNGYSLNTSEKIFLQSAQQYGPSFDFQNLLIQSKDLEKVATFAQSNPTIIATQLQTAPPAAILANTPTSSPSSTPSTTAGKAAGVVGEGIGTVAGGAGKLIGTVASETVSTWSTILSEATKTGGAMGAVGVIGLLIGSIWKFGFWKTMMGVVGIGGASALVNAAEDGTLDKVADKMKRGGDKLGSALDKITGEAAPSAAPAAAVVAPAVTVTSMPKSEQDAEKKVLEDKELIGYIEKKENHPTTNAKPQAYIDFIRSIKDTDLKTLISPNDDPKNGIFGTGGWDSVFAQKIPNTLDRALLKDAMRLYLTGESIRASGIKSDGSTWEKYKSRFDLSKPLSEEIKKTYIQNNSASGVATSTIDEDKIKTFTITGTTPTKIEITKNTDGTFTGKYTLPKIGNFEPKEPFSISYDANGNITTPLVIISGKDGPIGTARKTATITKSGNNIEIKF